MVIFSPFGKGIGRRFPVLRKIFLNTFGKVRITINAEGMRRKVHLSDYLLLVLEYNGTRFEPKVTDLVKRKIRKGSVFVDVGAFYGHYSLIASKLGAKVYSFEPEKEAFDLLVENIKLNGCKNIEIFPYALSDRNQRGLLHVPRGNSSGGTIRKLADDRDFVMEKVEFRRLDDIIDYADLVKIDVEGAEPKVLRGMGKLIKKCRPPIIIEYVPEFYEDRRELPSLIAKFGYAMKRIDKNNFLCEPKHGA
ncbi:MAG TPA: FkbM family methyltransferase [Candidatus Norongarragalinales archaeon]|nr:FkbM family methyltransferase [Candidatus Norongarragalinales archaeon]